jgi:hypothetical protein
LEVLSLAVFLEEFQEDQEEFLGDLVLSILGDLTLPTLEDQLCPLTDLGLQLLDHLELVTRGLTSMLTWILSSSPRLITF